MYKSVIVNGNKINKVTCKTSRKSQFCIEKKLQVKSHGNNINI